jgi:hypothetical protein
VPNRPAPIPGRPAVVQPPTIHKVQYDVSVAGSFYQLIRYINLLEQQRRFIGVDNFSIGKGAGDSSNKAKAAAPKRDLKISIYSYTYKQPQKPLELDLLEERSGKSTDIPD